MSGKRKEGNDSFGYDTFLSPFTWRYGSDEMRAVFSEKARRATWREIWLELAKAESEFGLISDEELQGISARASAKHVDIAKAHELERKIRHDLMAELRTFAAQTKKGGGKLHLGATSMDIEDNSDALLFNRALELTLTRLVNCLGAMREKVQKYKGMVCMAWTHLQPAEPTTMGYRFANYAQDLVIDIELLEVVRDRFLKGKGMKGAVGTSASFTKLLGTGKNARRMEAKVMEGLGLDYFPLSTQTYPRKVEVIIMSCLASIAASCYKFGLDLRVLQSPAFGELSEPMEEFQVGSSAMPFKRNPVTAERMCSLARLVSAFPPVAFGNAANSILERTLDDSANRRVVMPEAFLAIDECLIIYERLVRGLRVYPAMIEKNLEKFGPFAGTEAIMMKLVEKGGDRQAIHELIRVQSFLAWEEVMKGKANPLAKLLSESSPIASKLKPAEVEKLLDPRHHTGDAEERCEIFLRESVNPILKRHKKKLGAKSRVEY
ncbi:MAG: adenylosuccinate lyase [Thaumarchaeota archaeon]|nr:adenylosuccinate lyase [Nitrososphaerota archaeon]